MLSDSVKSSSEIGLLTEVERKNYYLSEAATVQTPFFYIAFSIFLLAIIFAFINLPKVMQVSPKGGYITLLKKKSLLMGALGIFLYVGVEVAIGSFLVNYFFEMNLANIILENQLMM